MFSEQTEKRTYFIHSDFAAIMKTKGIFFRYERCEMS